MEASLAIERFCSQALQAHAYEQNDLFDLIGDIRL